MTIDSVTPSVISFDTDNILVKFHWDCGRMGDVDGMFITTRAQLAQAMGKHVDFGEILGKHSEIYGELSEGDITIVTDDQDFLAKMQGYVGCDVSGYNPLKHMS